MKILMKPRLIVEEQKPKAELESEAENLLHVKT
jgi:hypothetical protein